MTFALAETGFTGSEEGERERERERGEKILTIVFALL